MGKLLILIVITLFTFPSVRGQRVEWITDYQVGLDSAKKAGRPMLVDFTATWCDPCLEMERKFWPNPEVVELSKNFVCVRLNFDTERDVADKYLVRAIPNVVFADPWGRGLNSQLGFGSGSEAVILEKMNIIPKDFSSVFEAGNALAKDEKRLDALYSMASFYQERGLFWVALDFQIKIAKSETDPAKLETALLNLAFNQIRLGDSEAAISRFETMQKNFPASPRNDLYLYGLIVANMRRNKPDKAIKLMSELKSKFPTSKYITEAEKAGVGAKPK